MEGYDEVEVEFETRDGESEREGHERWGGVIDEKGCGE